LWTLALLVFVFCAVYPVGTTATRAAGVLSFAVLWIGLLALLWKRPLWRWVGPAVTVAVAVFLLLPGQPVSPRGLREKYAGCLRRYEGVHYVRGGENALGIDCSGLARRGLMDALFLEGVRTFNPALVRAALGLWWNDASAQTIAESRELTVPVEEAPQINLLDHARLRPGDMAVTASGVHLLIYLGDQTWIEADPTEERVVVVRVPSQSNSWLTTPVRVVRWKILEP
jgi:energy-coupling factor transporter transmembrane protein EcfT